MISTCESPLNGHSQPFVIRVTWRWSRGETRIRYRLSIQEEPPNDWYVCVLCGKRLVPDSKREQYCIIVITEDERGNTKDKFYLPVHTDCIISDIGDPDVRLRIRRYSSEIRNKLQRARRARRQREMEACEPTSR